MYGNSYYLHALKCGTQEALARDTMYGKLIIRETLFLSNLQCRFCFFCGGIFNECKSFDLTRNLMLWKATKISAKMSL